RVWPFLRRPQTHRFLAVVATVGAIALSMAGSSVIYDQWQRSHRLDVAAAGFFEQRKATSDVVMYSDPATLALLSGNPGVAAPFDPFPVVRQVMDAYWNAAMRLRAGQPLYAPGLPTDSDLYRYAPWFAYAWVPLTYLPKGAVLVAWMGICLAAAIASVAPLLWRGPAGWATIGL